VTSGRDRIIQAEGNLVVVDFGRSDAEMSKKQLARALGRSTRWVEMRVSEGMPSTMALGRRMFQLSECRSWLNGRERRSANG
jgi:hypothetical protein